MHKYFIFLPLITLSCDHQPEKDAIKKLSIHETKVNILPEVTETLYKYAEDIKREGLKAEFRYLDTSVKFFWVPPGYPSAISYDSVAIILRANQHKYHYKMYEWKSLFVTQLSPVLANYSGVIECSLADSPDTIRLVETGVMIKRFHWWKLLSGQTAVISNSK